jgi:hypothetical protein
MDLSDIREAKNVSEAEMVRQINENLKGFSLDEALLSKYERGLLSRDRTVAIAKSIEKTYGSGFSSKTIKRSRFKLKVRRNLAMLFLVLLSVVITSAGYVYLENHPAIAKFEKVLGALAGLVSVIGFIMVVASSKRD